MDRTRRAVWLLFGGLLSAQDIHFKSRTLHHAQASLPDPDAARPGGAHRIVQFDHSPGVEDLNALLKGNWQIVGALPDNAVVVTADAAGTLDAPGIQWVGRFETSDKVSPELDSSGEPALTLVEFHADVTADTQNAAAVAEGVQLLRPKVLRPDHALLKATINQLRALAAHDEVAYIFPADPELLTTTSGLVPCLGMLTASGPVGQYANIVHGWDVDADQVAHLGFAFGSLTPKVPAATVKSEVVRALNEWTRYTNILFSAADSLSAPRTVLVKFVSGAHGDAWPFDGPGGVLAHTFYPVPVNAESLAGDMHLDADENWHAGGDVDIYSVALHEAGHAIGLGHSDKVGDVMYPYYRSHMALSDNDIGAIQALYGKPVPATAPVTEPGAPPATPVAQPAPLPTPAPGTGPSLPDTPAPAPLRLTLDAAAAAASGATISLTGTLSGGTAPYSVQWQSDHGLSGKAQLSGTAWMASGVSLVNGSNTLTVTAFDSARQSATLTTATTFTHPPPAPSAGAGPPVSVSITAPASKVASVSSATLTVSGTATAGAGISRVTWQTAAGVTGIAIGTGKWIAQGVPLLIGTNTIVLRAWDNAGASAWSALVAVRR